MFAKPVPPPEGAPKLMTSFTRANGAQLALALTILRLCPPGKIVKRPFGGGFVKLPGMLPATRKTHESAGRV